MPRYRYRSHSYRSQWASERRERHVREAAALEEKYQELYGSVKRSFFAMERATRAALLQQYRMKYGEKAYEYALETIPKWHAGTVRMSGQTMTRLLGLVPEHVSAEQKFEFVTHARTRTLQLLTPNVVKIDLAGGKTIGTVLAQCLSAIASHHEITFPVEFTEIRSWVTANDSKMMEQLVVDIEQEAYRERILKTVLLVPYFLALKSALPVGMRMTITVNIPTLKYVISYTKTKREASSMESDSDFLTAIERAETDRKLKKGEITLHEYLLRNWDEYITEEQQAELRRIALKQTIALDELKTRLSIQHDIATEDLEQFQQILAQLRAAKTRATATGTFTTASGEIKIESQPKRFGCAGVLVLIAPLILGAVALAERA